MSATVSNEDVMFDLALGWREASPAGPRLSHPVSTPTREIVPNHLTGATHDVLLHIDSTEQCGWTVLAMHGDLDVASAPQLRNRIIEAFAHSDAPLVLDLRPVAFIDSFGLGAIVGAHKRARVNARPLVLLTETGPVSELLTLTNLDQILDLRANLSDLADLTDLANLSYLAPAGE